jgi:hypothetical protein
MDAFVQNFFPDHKTPGVEFQFDNQPQTWCFTSGIINTKVDEDMRTSTYSIRQPMTPLGKLSASLERMGSVYDGIGKQFLTPEGQINFEAVSNNLKLTAGKSNAEVSGYISAAQSMRWDDNHISLIFNMMRYIMLKKISEVTGNLNGNLGTFRESGLQIEMDQYWPENYAAQCPFTTWPVAAVIVGQERSYVSVEHLADPFPTGDSAALDLRGLSREQSLFVLLMLNNWTRGSRFKLDFDLPRLIPAVFFRGEVNVTDDYTRWARGELEVPMLTADQAWGALRRYVTQNRVYEHFSTALYLTSALTYQFVPETAESIAWLDLNWKVVLPTFFSIRGRTQNLNTGEAAFLNQRPLDEWGYIANRLEKINLMALVFSQAFYTGLAMRSVRRCLEINPKDIYQSDLHFNMAENLISAAAAEFTRVPAPMSGTVGIYVTASELIELYDDSRVVVTANTVGQALPQTHTYGAVDRVVAQPAMQEIDPNALPADAPDRAEKIMEMQMNAASLEARRRIKPDYAGTPEELAASRGRILVMGPATVPVRLVTVIVPMMTFPGYPVYLTPTSPFPYPSLYQEAGTFEGKNYELEARGATIKLREAWRLLNFLSMAGYSVRYDIKGQMIGARAFNHGRYSRQLWPVLYEPEDSDDPVVLKEQTTQQRVPMYIPNVCNSQFKKHSIAFKYSVIRRGAAGGALAYGVDVTEFGGHVQLLKTTATVTFAVDEGIKRARGYISRGEMDFQYVSTAKVGVVPPGNPETDVRDAIEDSASGGGNV